MGQAKLREKALQSLSSGPLPEGGLSLLFKRDGISAALAVRPGEGGQVHAGLFCVDDWQEGLFQCLGRAYDSTAQFQEELKLAGGHFRPAPLEECRLRVARGLRIRRQARASEPKDFSRWAFLLGDLETVPMPEALYSCPSCEAAAPAELCKKILDCVGGTTRYYFPCPDCVRQNRPGVVPHLAIVSHNRARSLFENLVAFSLKLEPESANLTMIVPTQPHRDAVRQFVEKDHDPVLAAAFALETWMNRATGPNETITDSHVRMALEEILESRRSHAAPAGDVGREVKFTRDAAEKGLTAFAEVFKDRWSNSEREAYASAGIEKVLASVKRRQSPLNRRSYIDFIARHFK